jgi:hypothetical protein
MEVGARLNSRMMHGTCDALSWSSSLGCKAHEGSSRFLSICLRQSRGLTQGRRGGVAALPLPLSPEDWAKDWPPRCWQRV